MGRHTKRALTAARASKSGTAAKLERSQCVLLAVSAGLSVAALFIAVWVATLPVEDVFG